MTEPARDVGNPRPGWFRMKLRSDGPWLPARLDRDCHCTVTGGDDQARHEWREACDRYPLLRAVLDGREVRVDTIWINGREITEADHQYLVASLAFDRATDPLTGRPDQPIDLNRINPERFLP